MGVFHVFAQYITIYTEIKAAVADVRYFMRNIFLRSLFHKTFSGLIWQVVFKLERLISGRR